MKKTTPAKPTATKPGSKPATKTGTASKPAAGGAKGAASSTSKAKPAPKKEPAKAAKPVVRAEPIYCDIRQISKIAVGDENGDLKKAGKWPLLVDPSERAATFLRYTHANLMNWAELTTLHPSKLRLSLIGALRWGKMFAIELDEAKDFHIIRNRMDEIKTGLLDMVLDKSFLEEENYTQLLDPADGEEFHLHQFTPMMIENFKFCIVTKDPAPTGELLDLFVPIFINE